MARTTGLQRHRFGVEPGPLALQRRLPLLGRLGRRLGLVPPPLQLARPVACGTGRGLRFPQKQGQSLAFRLRPPGLCVGLGDPGRQRRQLLVRPVERHLPFRGLRQRGQTGGQLAAAARQPFQPRLGNVQRGRQIGLGLERRPQFDLGFLRSRTRPLLVPAGRRHGRVFGRLGVQPGPRPRRAGPRRALAIASTACASRSLSAAISWRRRSSSARAAMLRSRSARRALRRSLARASSVAWAAARVLAWSRSWPCRARASRSLASSAATSAASLAAPSAAVSAARSVSDGREPMAQQAQRLGLPQLLAELAVAQGLAALLQQLRRPPLQLDQPVGGARQVGFGGLQPQLGLAAPAVQPADAGCFLEQAPALAAAWRRR